MIPTVLFRLFLPTSPTKVLVNTVDGKRREGPKNKNLGIKPPHKAQGRDWETWVEMYNETDQRDFYSLSSKGQEDETTGVKGGLNDIFGFN